MPGLDSVKVIPLQAPPGSPPLWAAFSQGFQGIDPPQNHFVAIYSHRDGVWQELARVELPSMGVLSEQGLEQVEFEPGQVWLKVEGGVGAHGGCFDLLRYSGQALESMLSNCFVSPGAGELGDLDGDGVPEVLLNASDYYVFCYACGVRVFSYQIWRWDGEQMVQVQLTNLPETAPEPLRQLNNEAVRLAQAELWKDALVNIEQAAKAAPDDPVVAWNTVYITLHALRRGQAVADSPYPLLSHIFYGDWQAALEVVRPYSPQELFSPATPLVTGTVAEGWVEPLRDWVSLYAGKALEAQPDLAPAYFLRGWAAYLVIPSDPAVLADLQKAAELDPDEPLYADSLQYLNP